MAEGQRVFISPRGLPATPQHRKVTCGETKSRGLKDIQQDGCGSQPPGLRSALHNPLAVCF